MPVLGARYHNRRHSWPPFPRLTAPFTYHDNKSIDEDPFSFFISEDHDDEGYVSDFLDADIELPPRPKSLSPFRGARKRRRRSSGEGHENAIFHLRRWMKRMEAQYFDRRQRHPGRQEERTLSPDLLPQPFAPTQQPRGRNGTQYLSRKRPNHRQVRSHSGKPRTWQQPAFDIWTVAEEDDQDTSGLGLSI